MKQNYALMFSIIFLVSFFVENESFTLGAGERKDKNTGKRRRVYTVSFTDLEMLFL